MTTRKPAAILVNLKVLPRPRREDYRRKAYGLFGEGLSAYAAAKALKVNHSTVKEWYAKFKGVGEGAVVESKRGPTTSPLACLTPKQLRKLTSVIADKTPDQLKFDFALWSSRAICAYIKDAFGVTICRRTARRYMRRNGFTYQCPVRHAREQNPKAVREWLDKTYPAIESDARRRGARIMWADESATMVCQQKVRGYASRGKPPVVRIPANRSVRCNMISAVGNRGDMHFMLYDEAMNVDLFKSFITRLIHDMRCPVSLIVDNLRVHHATVLTEWLKERKEKDGFTLHYLPSYSPELNPDEYLNRDLKAHLSERSVPTSRDALKKSVRRHLQSRKSNPDSIKRLFRKKEVAYAAEKDS